MSSYAYVAVDPHGCETRGTLVGADQAEALRRVKEMGLFPTGIVEASERPVPSAKPRRRSGVGLPRRRAMPMLPGRVRTARLAIFTRQLATLVEAGMPLLRGLRILHEQEENSRLKAIIGQLGLAIEGGSSLAEAVAQHPTTFNRLYVSMVRAGELGGALEVTLSRLADFMEKAQRLKGKVRAALFYPCAVLVIAAAILGLMMAFVVPRFQSVFDGLMNGQQLPWFTQFVFGLSNVLARHMGVLIAVLAMSTVSLILALRTRWGRRIFDRVKLGMPVLGPLFRKTSISHFARTLGTLMSNGVPILQSLLIVKDAVGNVVVGEVVSLVHENVTQGEPLAPTLKSSSLFPAMVAGMVDVGEQTGALPDMLLKIANNYDEEVENAAGALTSLLEPLMLIFLAVIVGSIVFAIFLPLIIIVNQGFDAPGGGVQI